MIEMSETPLANQDAEAAVLSAMMMDHRCVLQVRETLPLDAFYRSGHRRIFEAMLRLHDAGGVLDVIAVADDLQRHEELHSVGGKDYLLYLIDAAATAANVEYHVRIVRSLYERRQVLDACRVAVERIQRSPDAAQAVAQDLSDLLLPISSESSRTGYEHIDPDRALREIERRITGSASVYATGIPSLDRSVYGGFWPKDLIIFAAGPKAGKSAISHAILLNNARKGVPVAICSAELSHEEITERTMAGMANVSLEKIARGDLQDDELRRLAEAGTQLKHLPVWIDDAAGPTLTDVIARGVALKIRYPSLGMILVDYLQLVQHRLKGRSEVEELKAIAYGLKELAKRTNCAVIAPAQLNYKQVDGRSDARPAPRDIQGTSAVYQACDWLFLMHRPGGVDPLRQGELELIIPPGRRHKGGSVFCWFDGDRMKYTSHQGAT